MALVVISRFLAPHTQVRHTCPMSAQAATPIDQRGDEQLLDVDTSAAILRWLETGAVPDGLEPSQWERWVDGGCQGQLEVDGMPVSTTMLGRWALTGALR